MQQPSRSFRLHLPLLHHTGGLGVVSGESRATPLILERRRMTRSAMRLRARDSSSGSRRAARSDPFTWHRNGCRRRTCDSLLPSGVPDGIAHGRAHVHVLQKNADRFGFELSFPKGNRQGVSRRRSPEVCPYACMFASLPIVIIGAPTCTMTRNLPHLRRWRLSRGTGASSPTATAGRFSRPCGRTPQAAASTLRQSGGSMNRRRCGRKPCWCVLI